MKKLVLVMVSALIIIIFIAFNYLLWDSENKEKDIENLKYLNINNNSRINAYERDIKTLEEEVKQYKALLEKADSENKSLLDEKLQLENEKLKQEELYEQKLELINILKQQVDLKPLEEPIIKWLEAIDSGDYDIAYKLLKRQRANQYSAPSLEEFKKNYKNSINGMSLKSTKLAVDDVPDEMKGLIVFEVLIDVSMVETAEKNSDGFEAGENKRFITVDYDKENKTWVIIGISSSM